MWWCSNRDVYVATFHAKAVLWPRRCITLHLYNSSFSFSLPGGGGRSFLCIWTLLSKHRGRTVQGMACAARKQKACCQDTERLKCKHPSLAEEPWVPRRRLTACVESISLMLWSYCSARIASFRVCSSLSRLRTALCSLFGVVSSRWFLSALYCLVWILHVSWNCFFICSSFDWKDGGDTKKKPACFKWVKYPFKWIFRITLRIWVQESTNVY